jgi:hypothetical protein
MYNLLCVGKVIKKKVKTNKTTKLKCVSCYFNTVGVSVLYAENLTNKNMKNILIDEVCKKCSFSF